MDCRTYQPFTLKEKVVRVQARNTKTRSATSSILSRYDINIEATQHKFPTSMGFFPCQYSGDQNVGIAQ